MKKKAKRIMCLWAVLVMSVCLFTVPAYATNTTDPLTIVNNLSDFIFSCIKAVGIIILGWGIVHVYSPMTQARDRRASFVCSAA